MKKLLFQSVVLSAAVALAEAPSVSGVHLAKGASCGYEITYSLANGPAVVTLDVETRATESDAWKSVGCRFGVATGDVSRVVSSSDGFIAWFPSADFGPAELRSLQIRAKVTAWPLDNPPDYMVVSLAENDAQRRTYYEREDLLPYGGVLSNEMYKTSHLPMRKILAKDVTWIMGSTNEVCGQEASTVLQVSANAVPHEVTLDENFYIAVFETTQSQLRLANGTSLYEKWTTEGFVRPSDGQQALNVLRGSTTETTDTPEVTASSIIGKFRNRTGVDFDLPTEAQWEFACRAGHGHGFWPDGTPMLMRGYATGKNTSYDCPQLHWLARFTYDGGAISTGADNEDEYAAGTVGPTNATAVVGSYPPNSWGLYDMIGNMTEWCRDWYAADITGLNGALVENRVGDTNSRIIRGGAFRSTPTECRPGARSSTHPTNGTTTNWVWGRAGFRLIAPCSAE